MRPPPVVTRAPSGADGNESPPPAEVILIAPVPYPYPYPLPAPLSIRVVFRPPSSVVTVVVLARALTLALVSGAAILTLALLPTRIPDPSYLESRESVVMTGPLPEYPLKLPSTPTILINPPPVLTLPFNRDSPT